MCELFGISSRFPTNVTFSLKIFGERGGHTRLHSHGWGIAYHEGRDFRIIKEPLPAHDSACLNFVENHDFRSEVVISHLRRATSPPTVSYTNTHPFVREVYGYAHVFAHNGDIPGILQDPSFAPSFYFPLGGTDSERAFCLLMDRLRRELSRDSIVDLPRKLPVIRAWAEEMSRFGIFNFLLSDTAFLYAYRSSLLFHVSRECFSQTECLRGEELTVRLARPQKEPQRLALVATDPLTSDESWLALPEGTVVVFSKGLRVE